VRDSETGEFWSPSWQPTRHELADYTCRHGLGYTIIGSAYRGIDARVRYFVPLGESLEVWQLTLTNRRETSADLSIFSSAEFALWDAQDDATNFQHDFNTDQVEVEDGVIYHITVKRAGTGNAVSLVVDGQPVAGDVTPLPPDGTTEMIVEATVT
jgi:cellobiose phosphorylase